MSVGGAQGGWHSSSAVRERGEEEIRLREGVGANLWAL